MNHCVVTTINVPTKAIEELYKKFGQNLIIVGDKKTPSNWEYEGITPDFSTAIYAPDNHYARKNLGYLEAIRNGAELIYDTDDDNIPNEKWGIRKNEVAVDVLKKNGWFNIYKILVYENTWVRGFPLSQIQEHRGHINIETELRKSSIQQGISNGEADVDAIYRLTSGKQFKFGIKRSVCLSPNTWSPFNSQSTWWFPKAYPLMYLPIHATFRMTDIWRSFVAQRCLWELGEGVTYHSPAEVYQDRNPHDLMKDFEQEIPGYLHNERIATILSALQLKQGEENISLNMMDCYLALIENNILPKEEIYSLIQWQHDYELARYMANAAEENG